MNNLLIEVLRKMNIISYNLKLYIFNDTKISQF